MNEKIECTVTTPVLLNIWRTAAFVAADIDRWWWWTEVVCQESVSLCWSTCSHLL